MMVLPFFTLSSGLSQSSISAGENLTFFLCALCVLCGKIKDPWRNIRLHCGINKINYFSTEEHKLPYPLG